MGEKENQKQEPISLLKLVTLGVSSSVLVVGGLFLLFAAYEAQTWFFWRAEEHLDPDTLFGVGRNAVTLAAALGVGITLFFSYRKQQTAESAQELAVRAQTMALESQRLATETLQLSLDKHDLEKVGGLRDRYARAAEQLASERVAIQVAGIHSLAALADDWASIENKEEQQVCVSLLCSYTVTTISDEDETSRLRAFALMDVMIPRLQLDSAHPTRSWGSCRVAVSDLDITQIPTDMRIVSGGQLSFTRCSWPGLSLFHRLVITNGNMSIEQELSMKPLASGFSHSRFEGGTVRLARAGSPVAESVTFNKCTFDGGNVEIQSAGTGTLRLNLDGCTFVTGSLHVMLSAGQNSVHFSHCRFESPDVVQLTAITRDALKVTFFMCEFVGDAKQIRQDPGASILSIAEDDFGAIAKAIRGSEEP